MQLIMQHAYERHVAHKVTRPAMREVQLSSASMMRAYEPQTMRYKCIFPLLMGTLEPGNSTKVHGADERGISCRLALASWTIII